MKTKNFNFFIIGWFSLIVNSAVFATVGTTVEMNTDYKNLQAKLVQIDSIVTPDVIQINWYLSASNAPVELEVERSQNRIQFDKIDQIQRSIVDSQTVKYTFYDFRPPAGRYFYRLKYSPENCEDQYSTPISVNASNSTQSLLEQNILQLRHPVDSIGFNLKKPEKVNLCIFNMFGQLVKNLVDDFIEKGHYRISWDGLDNLGLVVPGGIYFYQIMVGQHTETRKIQLIR